MIWTEQMVWSWIREAARTLHQLPQAQIKQRLSSWPEVVHKAMDAYGSAPSSARIFGAAPEEIDRLDVVMTWLWWLEPEARKLVWARAERVRWNDLAWFHKRSIRTLQNEHKAAVLVILHRLNEEVRRTA